MILRNSEGLWTSSGTIAYAWNHLPRNFVRLRGGDNLKVTPIGPTVISERDRSPLRSLQRARTRFADYSGSGVVRERS